MKSRRLSVSSIFLILLGLAAPLEAFSQILGADFVGPYSVRDLGVPEGVPSSLGGLTFKAGTTNTVLIGGHADGSMGQIYAIQVERGADGHIQRFVGPAIEFAEASGFGSGGIDGGLEYGPGGVLFYTTYDDNCLGQLKPGSTVPDKKTDLTGLGIVSSVGSLTFVPEGFPGAGRLKITSYSGYNWYDTTVSPDGSGTYSVMAPAKSLDFDQKPEGIFYVKGGSPRFAKPSVLVGFYTADSVRAFEVDANGDPIVSTTRDFITGLNGITGATRDPATGDFLFSSFTDTDVYIVGGFSTSPTDVRIVSPIEGQGFTQPVAFDIEASAAQAGGLIDHVEFYSNQGFLDVVRQPPYRTSTSGWASGNYSLFAVAYDGSGVSSTSAVVHVTVQNSPILVQLMTPTNGVVLPSCSPLQLTAQVSGGGTITNVTFFAGATELGHAIRWPYTFRARHFSEGSHSVYAVANDDVGAFGTSAPHSFTVLPLATNRLVATQVRDDQLLLCYKGPAGSNCVWATTEDITQPWRAFATNQSTTGLWEFTNALPAAVPVAFYRAWIQR